MKTNFLLLIVIICSTVLSCGDHMKFIELNDTLITVDDDLFGKYEAWSDKLDEIMELDPEDRNFQELKPYREAFDNNLQEQFKKVEGIENIGGSEKFKGAVMEFLNYQKKFSETHLKKFENYTSETTEDEIIEAGIAMVDAFEEEEKLINKISKEQKKYADKNGMELEER